MIRLPSQFIPTKYSGYFWDPVEKQLYSIKVSGLLRKMQPHKEIPGYLFNGKSNIPAGYAVSVDGTRRQLSFAYLGSLKPSKEEFVIGYKEI